MENDSLSKIADQIRSFRDERDWAQFHTPRKLAAALSVEAAEVQETILWLEDSEVSELLDSDRRKDFEAEIADVLIYAILLAESAGIDPAEAIRDKLALNRQRYPVEVSRGRAVKYDKLENRAD